MSNWRQLLDLAAPVIGGIAAGPESGANFAFTQAYRHSEQQLQAERERKRREEEQKRLTAAKFKFEIAHDLMGEHDPHNYEMRRQAAKEFGQSAFGMDPTQFDEFQFPEEDQGRRFAADVDRALETLRKQGHDIEELAQSNAEIELSGGRRLPIHQALAISSQPKVTQNGQIIGTPKKADVAPSTDFSRFLSRYAKGFGKSVGDLTTAEELDAKKQYGQADDKPVDPNIAAMRELQLGYLRGDAQKPTDPKLDKLRDLQILSAQQRLANGNTPKAPPPRKVLSSDVNRISEIDSSLNDVDVLERELSGNKATGAKAKAGAMLPNAITEFTGYGVDAKQKQAVINRVKQVIGKALEGGVLRKEDEAKYVLILPTIGDPPEIAMGKIRGLKKALAAKRATLLDNLDDAGFNVDPQRARGESRGQKADPLGIR